MLRTLRVRDLAIIEELELVLEPGLNVITGETGAGKSILLPALDLALGGRPDADLVPTGAGGLGRTREEMRVRHARLAVARTALAAARAASDAAVERAEMLRQQHEELVRATLVPGEEDQLGSERARLVHAERLTALATGAEEALYSAEGAVIDTLGRALGAVREAVRLDATLEPTRALLESALAELEEAGSGLGRYVRDLRP